MKLTDILVGDVVVFNDMTGKKCKCGCGKKLKQKATVKDFKDNGDVVLFDQKASRIIYKNASCLDFYDEGKHKHLLRFAQ